MRYVIGVYVIAMMLFWIQGEGTDGWNLYFYSLEKLFAASGFILLALYVPDKRISNLAIYAASVCVFMFLYYIWCLLFGHSSLIAVISFIFYSLILLYLLRR